MAQSQAPRGAVLSGVIAAALLLGVYVLVLVVALGAVAMATFAVLNFSGALAVKLVGVLAVIVFIVLAGVVRSLRRPRVEPEGIELTRAEQPRLWDTVERLASAVGTRQPDEIRLVSDANAAVTEESRWLGLRGGKRTMEIGAPLLLGLSAGQLASVLGHELGHYSGRHAAFGRMSWRGAEALLGIIRRMDYALVRAIFTGYARLYFRVSAKVRQQHEHDADTVAIAVTGRQPTITMLRRLPALALAWHLTLQEYGPMARSAGRTPDLFAGYWALLSERRRVPQFDEAVAAAVAEPTDRYASHPATGARIAAAAAQPDAQVPADNRPATVLVAYLPHTLQRLQQELVRADLGPSADWAELAALAARRETANVAGELVKVASPGTHDVTLGAILDGIAGGYGPTMVRSLVHPGIAPEDRPHAFRSVCTRMLAGCVASAMIEAGVARAVMNWAGPRPWMLIGLDGVPIDVPARVAPAVAAAMPDSGAGNPQGVSVLREWLTGMGVSLWHRIRAAEHDPLAPDLVAVALNVDLDKKPVDLLVCDTGLLFVPQSKRERREVKHAAIAITRRKINGKRLTKLLERPIDELRASEGAVFVGIHDIATARLTSKLLSSRFDIQLVNGAALSVATTSDVEEIDEPWEHLGAMLGARLQPA